MHGGGTRLWLANLTPAVQTVAVSGLASAATIVRLDADNFVAATTDPAGFAATPGAPANPTRLVLGPFATARVDIPI